MEKEVKQHQLDLESKQSEIKSLTQQSQSLQDDQQKLEQQLQEQKVRFPSCRCGQTSGDLIRLIYDTQI